MYLRFMSAMSVRRGMGCCDSFLQYHMSGQVRLQLFIDANGSHARTAAAMGDSESLMQGQVTYIGPDQAGAGKPHLGIHICSVHIHQATGVVDVLANVLDAFFQHAVDGSGS